jgi:thioredoxin domain-containing protein 5
MKVTQLLLSLLPTSLVVLASAEAAPVQLNVLNPDNFKDTIAKGVWYVALRYFNSKCSSRFRCIEFFSPYCHHCQGFAPTWTRLVENTEKHADPGVRLAQVNCAANGGLFCIVWKGCRS